MQIQAKIGVFSKIAVENRVVIRFGPGTKFQLQITRVSTARYYANNNYVMSQCPNQTKTIFYKFRGVNPVCMLKKSRAPE